MGPEQLPLIFSAGVSAGGEKLADAIEQALRLTRKTPGWNGRTAPPQFVDLGGCELVAIPAYLWRARVRVQHRGRHEVIALPRAS